MADSFGFRLDLPNIVTLCGCTPKLFVLIKIKINRFQSISCSYISTVKMALHYNFNSFGRLLDQTQELIEFRRHARIFIIFQHIQ